MNTFLGRSCTLAVLPLTLGLALTASACSGADTNADGAVSQEDPIEKGVIDNGHSAVGLVLADQQFCSGTLIAPDVVLTAGHCVETRVYSFYTGHGSTASLPASNMIGHRVAAQKAHPSYATASDACPSTGFDVGLLHLQTKITTITPIAIASAPPAKTTSCLTVGFGAHISNGNETYGEKRSATETVTSVGSTFLGIRLGTGIADHGDSGGPLLCGSTIAAVTSCGTDPSPLHTTGYYARVDAISAWIKRTIDAWHGVHDAEDGAQDGTNTAP